MNTSNTNNSTQYTDVLAKDFMTAAIVVSVLGNLTAFVSWIAYSIA